MVAGKTKQASEWDFYFKPNWYSSIQHINFNLTVAANHIKEDTVIICRRVDSSAEAKIKEVSEISTDNATDPATEGS